MIIPRDFFNTIPAKPASGSPGGETPINFGIAANGAVQRSIRWASGKARFKVRGIWFTSCTSCRNSKNK